MTRRSPGLSERHRKIMQFLSDFQDKHGYSPSIRQIGDSINVKSTSLIDYYLNQLEEMGYIDRQERISRSIRVLKAIPSSVDTLASKVVETMKRTAAGLEDLVSIPLAGRIVASNPLPMPPLSGDSYFDPESTVELARSLIPTRDTSDLFALQVDGESMIDAMINDGDIIIMRHASEAHNGEMVAVWLDDKDETTLKYFYKEANRIRLQPANPNMGPIYVDNPKSLRIMGKVVMVIRQVKNLPL